MRWQKMRMTGKQWSMYWMVIISLLGVIVDDCCSVVIQEIDEDTQILLTFSSPEFDQEMDTWSACGADEDTDRNLGEVHNFIKESVNGKALELVSDRIDFTPYPSSLWRRHGELKTGEHILVLIYRWNDLDNKVAMEKSRKIVKVIDKSMTNTPRICQVSGLCVREGIEVGVYLSETPTSLGAIDLAAEKIRVWARGKEETPVTFPEAKKAKKSLFATSTMEGLLTEVRKQKLDETWDVEWSDDEGKIEAHYIEVSGQKLAVLGPLHALMYDIIETMLFAARHSLLETPYMVPITVKFHNFKIVIHDPFWHIFPNPLEDRERGPAEIRSTPRHPIQHRSKSSRRRKPGGSQGRVNASTRHGRRGRRHG